MATVPIQVPGVGESITEGILAKWLKPDGSAVKAGEPLFELETDKASTVIPAPSDGTLKIGVAEGETVEIGATVGALDPDAAPQAAAPKPAPVQRLRRSRSPRQHPRPRSRTDRPRQRTRPERWRSPAPLARRPSARGRGGGRPVGLDRHRSRRRGHQGGRAPSPRSPDRVPGPRPEPVPGRRDPARRPATVSAGPSPRRGRPSRDPPADERHPPEDRPAARRGPADRRDPHDLQRGRHVPGHGTPGTVQGVVRQEARRQPRLHVLLREGGRRGAQGVPLGQRPDRGERNRPEPLLRHRRRRQHRARPDGPGDPRRRHAELRRDREGDRRLRQEGPRQRDLRRRPPGRHLHDHQRRRLRLACSPRRSSTRPRAASSACTRSRSAPSPSTTRSSSGR